ncbi:MAG: hypothetical protein HZB13_11860 [Acidobacteria bacterium]|nr:hypothetical protein [Acidobacteriota bacterium]
MVRLLKRERERESLRWQQFESLMAGRARMAEPGFALALWGVVLGQAGPCREAAEWALKSANLQNPNELRQAALVYDWCQTAGGETQPAMLARRLAAALKDHPPGMGQVRSGVFTAIALADIEAQASQEYLKWAVETWWKGRILPQLKAGDNPFARRGELYAMTEFIHAIRDNLRVDLREGAAKWFEEAAPLQMLSYYPQPWPAAENEYRIPAYVGRGDPDLREAVYSRAAELALVALDANAVPHQFLQGWLMQDRFLMRSSFGITYEFLWANPYQPGLSFSYMPDLFHGRGQLLARSGWDEDASWFGYWAGQAQAFIKGQRVAVKMDARPAPVTLGPVKIFFAASGLKLETGWQPPPEEGAREVEEVAFVVGLEPGVRYDVEVDDEEMAEAKTDSGGILELRFKPGRMAGVRIRKSPPR